MTTVQEYLNDLNSFQTPDGFRLGGKGPAMKTLASKIKVCFPTLNEEDKGLFLDAMKRGPFAINKDIWAMFLNAVGFVAPAPVAVAQAPVAPPATNKVAGEILDNTARTNAILLDLIGMVSDLQKQVDALSKPTTTRRRAKAKVQDSIELAAV